MTKILRMNLSKNSLFLLQKRYLKKDSQGKIIETPEQLFQRVSRFIAQADLKYPKQKNQYPQTQKQFYQLLSSLDFLPNSPTLMNAGTQTPQLAACFVLPIKDSLDSIFQTLHQAALIHKFGGGTGFDFSLLRSKNVLIKETSGRSSGPLSFIQVFDSATEQIKQGGKRRGANMAVLRIDHPDIQDFITAKQKFPLQNFNLSVAVTDKFIKAVKQNQKIDLINPHNKKRVKKLSARKLFHLLCHSAWQSGDPGILFIDTINKKHPLKEKITATNPCGEQPLLPYESCNLGSINLANHVKDEVFDHAGSSALEHFKNNQINWPKLKNTVRLAVHFLDNVIDRSDYLFPQIEKITKQNRKIGLGVMGFADLLIKLNISYNSPQAIQTAQKLMKFIHQEAQAASFNLAKLRGPFPKFPNSRLKQKQRNLTLTTIAPTGSLSLIANCSPSIEPLFALAFTHHILDHQPLAEINKHLLFTLKQKKLCTQKILNQIKREGTLKNIKNLTPYLKKLFITALEIPPAQHLKIQAAFQKYTDNAVSKTINLPPTATVSQIKKIFLQAHQLGCKGLTVYRYGSKPRQVLTFGFSPKCKVCR